MDAVDLPSDWSEDQGHPLFRCIILDGMDCFCFSHLFSKLPFFPVQVTFYLWCLHSTRQPGLLATFAQSGGVGGGKAEACGREPQGPGGGDTRAGQAAGGQGGVRGARAEGRGLGVGASLVIERGVPCLNRTDS